MNKIYILNAFSFNMINAHKGSVEFLQLDKDQAYNMAFKKTENPEREIISAIGHADTAAVISDELGVLLTANRINVGMFTGDSALICQYSGPRLPEGAMTLPEGATIKYFWIDLFYKI